MKRGFTLIELLVVISIISVLSGLLLVALGGVRAGGRDTRRRGDLEQVRSGLELFRSDCGKYPASLTFGGSLVGDASTPACAAANTYISATPQDPQPVIYSYYYSGSTNSYSLCAYLETTGAGAASGCGSNQCGGGTVECNYKITNP